MYHFSVSPQEMLRLGAIPLQEVTARVKVARTHHLTHKYRLKRWRPQEGKKPSWLDPCQITSHMFFKHSAVAQRATLPCLLMFGTVSWFNREVERFSPIALCKNAFLNQLITSIVPDCKIRTTEDNLLWSSMKCLLFSELSLLAFISCLLHNSAWFACFSV